MPNDGVTTGVHVLAYIVLRAVLFRKQTRGSVVYCRVRVFGKIKDPTNTGMVATYPKHYIPNVAIFESCMSPPNAKSWPCVETQLNLRSWFVQKAILGLIGVGLYKRRY